MLMQPAPMPMPQTAFRPIVATIVMVLLLYSLFSGDWAAPANHGRRADLRQLGFPESPRAEEFPSIHEKIIHELSLSNEKLERENWQMKQHILDMRRAMRKEGVEANSTLFTYPDLEKGLKASNETHRLPLDRHRTKRHSNTSDHSNEGSKEQSEGVERKDHNHAVGNEQTSSEKAKSGQNK